VVNLRREATHRPFTGFVFWAVFLVIGCAGFSQITSPRESGGARAKQFGGLAIALKINLEGLPKFHRDHGTYLKAGYNSMAEPSNDVPAPWLTDKAHAG
jgi:hypothetical protein